MNLRQKAKHFKRLYEKALLAIEKLERFGKALQFAISSLKTDEAYQLEYEHIPYITLDELKEIREELNEIGFDYWFECGEYIGECQREIRIMNADKAMKILDKKISELEGGISDHHKQNIKAYAHDFGVSEKQAEKELRVEAEESEG